MTKKKELRNATELLIAKVLQKMILFPFKNISLESINMFSTFSTHIEMGLFKRLSSLISLLKAAREMFEDESLKS